jgi:hypothetical protein
MVLKHSSGVMFCVELTTIFPSIYLCCEEKDSTIATILQDGVCSSPFTWAFGPVEVREWEELIEIVGGVRLSDSDDMVQWKFEKNKKFSTRSM